jgi:hypothetical protein
MAIIIEVFQVAYVIITLTIIAKEKSHLIDDQRQKV